MISRACARARLSPTCKTCTHLHELRSGWWCGTAEAACGGRHGWVVCDPACLLGWGAAHACHLVRMVCIWKALGWRKAVALVTAPGCWAQHPAAGREFPVPSRGCL